jgi:hypothetical protein
MTALREQIVEAACVDGLSVRTRVRAKVQATEFTPSPLRIEAVDHAGIDRPRAISETER